MWVLMTRKDAKDPMIGITPMMNFFARNYKKRYAPNLRETEYRELLGQLDIWLGLKLPAYSTCGRDEESELILKNDVKAFV